MKKTVNDSIQELLRDYDSLYSFYRAVYKGTACGPSIGFKIAGTWYYCDELYELKPDAIQKAEGIAISSIVEGSDVEIEGAKLETYFDPDNFWKILEGVNREADFYWQRDNSIWMQISEVDTLDIVGWLHWTEFDEQPTPDDLSHFNTDEQHKILKTVKDNFDELFYNNGPITLEMRGIDYQITEYENDMIY